MSKAREDLLQTLVDQLHSVIKQITQGLIPRGPLVSPPQARILFALADRREGMSVKELAGVINVTPGAITQFVDILVKKGLVSREQDARDRRKVRLKLTETARSRFNKFKKEHLASATRVFTPLNDAELRQLTDLLRKVSSAPD